MPLSQPAQQMPMLAAALQAGLFGRVTGRQDAKTCHRTRRGAFERLAARLPETVRLATGGSAALPAVGLPREALDSALLSLARHACQPAVDLDAPLAIHAAPGAGDRGFDRHAQPAPQPEDWPTCSNRRKPLQQAGCLAALSAAGAGPEGRVACPEDRRNRDRLSRKPILCLHRGAAEPVIGCFRTIIAYMRRTMSEAAESYPRHR